jgi:predicted nuclease of predicted toxin-antitoxin system
MKLLADENVHALIVLWLREQQHDVLAATESLLGQPDSALLEVARREDRVIVTSDLDFGELVFNQRLATHGVVLLRMEDLPVADRLNRLAAAWSVVEANPQGYFIVITDVKVRVRPMVRD